MKELLIDIRGLLLEHDSLKYIRDNGGVIALPDLAQFPQQSKTPLLILIDTGTNPVSHFSSRVRGRTLQIRIHCIQRIFQRGRPISGSPFEKSVEEVASDVVKVLDANRFNGKYARAFLTAEEIPTPFETRNMHLQEKALTFEYLRLECM